jgi:hypothetical protein
MSLFRRILPDLLPIFVALFFVLPAGVAQAQAQAPSAPMPSSLSLNVMGPLVIGNPQNPDDPASQGAWQEFYEQLKKAKALGFQAVSTDLWWGLIEARQGHYRWAYYDKIVSLI